MSDDKDLPPSEKKLRKGLEESQDQQSQEVTSLVAGLVLATFFYVAVPRIAGVVVPLMRLSPLAVDDVGSLRERIGTTVAELLGGAEIAAAVLLAAALSAGVLANIANRRRPPGVKAPKLSYNPMSSAKQMFKPSQLLALAKLWLICLMVMAVVAFMGWRHLPEAVMGVYLGPSEDIAVTLSLPWTVVPLVVLILGLSAVVDAVQKHNDFVKSNRMDHEEVKKENKEDNGDPLIKSKRIELAREE